MLFAYLLAQIGARPSHTSSREEDNPEDPSEMTTSYRIGTEEEGSREEMSSRHTFFRLNPDPNNPNLKSDPAGRRHRDGDEEQEEEGDKKGSQFGGKGAISTSQSFVDHQKIELFFI